MRILNQIQASSETEVQLNSLDPIPQNIDSHPYRKLYEKEWDQAKEFGLDPTIYFLEAVAYHERAELLQKRNLGEDVPIGNSTDDLQDNVHIYDTVTRWYAGFSNALQSFFLGTKNPKYEFNKKHNLPQPDFRLIFNERDWLYVFLVHRVSGSGASFSLPGDPKLPAHGWYNTPVPMLCSNSKSMSDMISLLAHYDRPIFSSKGNQIPSFNKKTIDYYRNSGIEYLCETAPKVVKLFYQWLLDEVSKRGVPIGIQEATERALSIQRSLGHKQFKFVFTAWIMDIAEYYPELVDENSNVFHGKNAVEAIELCFNKKGSKSKGQKFYDDATRLFSDIFGTRPMDVEDAAPGCDIIRWLNNMIQKDSYLHVDRTSIFHKCYLKHPNGRQRWKLGTSDWVW